MFLKNLAPPLTEILYPRLIRTRILSMLGGSELYPDPHFIYARWIGIVSGPAFYLCSVGRNCAFYLCSAGRNYIQPSFYLCSAGRNYIRSRILSMLGGSELYPDPHFIYAHCTAGWNCIRIRILSMLGGSEMYPDPYFIYARIAILFRTFTGTQCTTGSFDIFFSVIPGDTKNTPFKYLIRIQTHIFGDYRASIYNKKSDLFLLLLIPF